MIAIMIESALRALMFAAVVGLGLPLLRVSNVPVRKAAWSVVLVASLAMPFLMHVPARAGWAGRLGWVVPIRARKTAAPVVVKKSVASGHAQAVAILTSPDHRKVVLSAPEPSSIVISASPMTESAVTDAVNPETQGLHWPAPWRLVAMIYLVGCGALLLRLVWGLGVALRLWMTADLVSPLVAPEPNVRSSSKIPSPVTIGSGIVLPASYTEWDMKKLRMVLAHERSHVRQLDFYLQVLAGLYTALFWFSPLGWWLRRTLSSLGEAIGDRAGIDAAASRTGYAEILLEFAAMPRQTLPGVAMARPGNLSRRIEWLLNEHHFRIAFAEGRRRAWVSLLLIPAALFAATVLVRVPGVAAQTAPAAPTSTPASAAPANPAPAPTPTGQTAPWAPAAPSQDEAAPPAAPEAPGAPPEPQGAEAPEPPPADGEANGYLADGNIITVHGPDANLIVDGDGVHGFAYQFSEGGDSYAVVDPSETSYSFSGEWSQDRKADIDAARKVAKGPFLWFTREDKAYVVDDPVIVAKIRAMYKPMEELGRQQEELGRKQEELGKQQEELARQEEEAGDVRVPDLSKEIADLDAAVARFKEDREQVNTKQLAEAEASLKAAENKVVTPEKMSELQEALSAAQVEWSSERIAEMQAKVGELQARLGELQGTAGSRQGVFGARMGALGAQQGQLGSEQGRLGAEEGRLAREADRQVRSIINDCLRSGKATEVPSVK